jgi:hypothetical protein
MYGRDARFGIPAQPDYTSAKSFVNAKKFLAKNR